MNDLHAAVLGVVQGATEFLPVSSTAHILLVDKLFFHEDAGAAFTAIIQWGTVLAAILYFRREILSVLLGRSTEPGEGNLPDRRLLVPIIVGTIPIAILGLLLKHKIEGSFRGIPVVAASMIAFALLLAVAERMYRPRRDMGDIGVKDGLLVGLAQACSLIPGASRSGTTITGAMLIGMERSTAARFSFLLGLPAVTAAGLKELVDVVRHPVAGQAVEARPVIIATVVSFVVGYAAIDWLVKFLRRHPTHGFIVYRVLVGVALLSLFYSGRIKDTPPAPETAAARAVTPRGQG